MYQYLFGNADSLPMYDLVGILGYFIIIGITFYPPNILKKSRSLGTLALYLKNHRDVLGKSQITTAKFLDDYFWAKTEIGTLVLVHIVTYTFAGELFGDLIGRRTDFYGYVFGTNVAICVVCYILGLNVLQELDNLVPIYLAIASFLKIGCLCAGCCNGLEWEYGLYNHCTERYEFPIQLVEGVTYAIFLFFLKSYKKRVPTGYLAPIFLILYSSFRFLIQFFRTDSAVFSLFHLISLLVLILGFINMFIVYKYRQQIMNRFSRKVNATYIGKKIEKQ